MAAVLMPTWSAAAGFLISLIIIANSAIGANFAFGEQKPHAVLIDDKTALVSGVFTCRKLEDVSIVAAVVQSHGTVTVAGRGERSRMIASGTTQAFSVPVHTTNPARKTFTDGGADVVVTVSCGADEHTFSAKVRL
jgi:hypothetical protein